MKAVIAILSLAVMAHAAAPGDWKEEVNESVTPGPEDWKEKVFNESLTRLTNKIDEQKKIVKNAAKVHLSAQICVILARLRFDYELVQGHLKYRSCTDNSADQNEAKKCIASVESVVFRNVLDVTEEALTCVKIVSKN